jgi:predicted RNase H-like nuclease (RuvC/YqgF family)
MGYEEYDVCGVCVHELLHELLHKCGGIVFADVWGGMQICNCVRMQALTAPTAPPAPTADAVTHDELQANYETQGVNLKAANGTIETQREGLQAAETIRQTLNKANEDLQAKLKTLEEERDKWKEKSLQWTEELKVLKEEYKKLQDDYKKLQVINEVCGE